MEKEEYRDKPIEIKNSVALFNHDWLVLTSA